MKKIIALTTVLALISGSYLMTAHLLGEHFMWTWQGNCMAIILFLSLVYLFVSLIIVEMEEKQNDTSNNEGS